MPQSSKQLLTSYQLVHVNRQYEIAKANKKVDLINLPCPAASKIIREILQLTFSLNDLCIILKLPQATANNHVGFVEAPELGTMIKFFIILGHVVAIHLAGQFYTKDIPQPLQTLGKVLMRILTSSIMSIDQPLLAIMKMFYCIINNVYVDYVALMWEDEDVNKIVEGDNAIADEFTDTVFLSQKDLNTRIDPRSYKE
ncbi:hypothetical protein Tco_0397579 [Tanacetum coccineum]